ncbi:MAG: sensor histidine kinase [Polyangia bacterium]
MLADFIRSNREAILVEWEAFARSMPTATAGMSATELRDHGGPLLDAIAADMEHAQSIGQQAEKSKGRGHNGLRLDRVGDQHGGDRVDSGFRLEQVVAEFRALRASVIRLWEKSVASSTNAADAAGVTRFHEAIDQALAQSVTQTDQMLSGYRDLFVGILGHDLRGPLSAIQIGADLLVESEETPDIARKVGARISNSARKMTRMVSDLLDLTRTRFGKSIPVELAPLDLGEVCRATVEELEIGLRDGAICYSTTGNLEGRWDAVRIAQVVSNLVTNARHHGKASAPIAVEVAGHDDGVVIAVHNEGEPIPATLVASLFEPLVQGERRRARSGMAEGNLGLGLYIVKQIAIAHGGTVDVESSATKGTTFRVRLPRDSSATHEAEAAGREP